MNEKMKKFPEALDSIPELALKGGGNTWRVKYIT